jgi:hypothetical protein
MRSLSEEDPVLFGMIQAAWHYRFPASCRTDGVSVFFDAQRDYFLASSSRDGFDELWLDSIGA